ncbi:MAG: DUF1439 domain-containing protein [Formosimonas sp.]|jgi:hypothetical protein
MKLFKWLIVLLVVSGLTLVGCQALKSDHSFRVSQSQLQKLVNRNWTTTAAKLQENNITIASPTIDLQPNEQRIGATFDAYIDLGLIKVEGVMTISGVPAYSETQGAVMLNDMRVDKFEANHLPDGIVKSQAQKMIGKKFGLNIPIYEISPEKLSFAGKKWIPQTINVERDALEITLQPK